MMESEVNNVNTNCSVSNDEESVVVVVGNNSTTTITDDDKDDIRQSHHLPSSQNKDHHEPQTNGDTYNNKKPANDTTRGIIKIKNPSSKLKISAGFNGGVAMQRWQILAKATLIPKSDTNGQEGSKCSFAEKEKQMWIDHILKNKLALGGKKKTNALNLSPVSVRRFSSFSLLRNRPNLDDVPSETDATWHEYTCPGGSKNLSINIRLLPKEVSFDSIFGFNNTGNVCIWPSEEVLAYYCLKHSNMFSGKRICELGGGMTCLAGICVAAASNATHVELTDGNENSIKNVHHIVKHNRARNIFDNTDVHARCLRWGTDLENCKHLEKFDYILSADCLFFEEGRMDLIDTIDFLLKPGGEALVFAPTRKNSFNEFLQLASSVFFCSVVEKYDDVVWQRHLEMLSESSSVYEKDLHYPILLLLQKTEVPTE